MRCWFAAMILAAGGLVLLWWHYSSHPATRAQAPASDSSRVIEARTVSNILAQPAPAQTSWQQSNDSLPAGPATTSKSASPEPAQVAPLAAELERIAPETALENMRTTIRQYGATFGGNPVGANPEISSALQGQNPKQINFLKQDGNRVNSRGELVDIWGTPYFFHALSGTEMEIRSAGPDRIMYTADDLVTK